VPNGARPTIGPQYTAIEIMKKVLYDRCLGFEFSGLRKSPVEGSKNGEFIKSDPFEFRVDGC
jgi:hypothetical protein